MKTRTNSACSVCKGTMDGRPKTAKICAKPKCLLIRNRDKARAWSRKNLCAREKTCRICHGKFFRSQKRKKLCSNKCIRESIRRFRKQAKAKAGRKK